MLAWLFKGIIRVYINVSVTRVYVQVAYIKYVGFVRGLIGSKPLSILSTVEKVSC